MATTHVQQRRHIRSINKQIIAEFHPTIKNVTAAGQSLIRCYGDLNKAFYTYTASLYALSYSGRNGEPPTQTFTEQILRHAETMKRIHSEQQAWLVDYFSKMIILVGHNNGTEKDRLRALMYSFDKKEREMAKAVGKKKATPAEMDAFYEAERQAMAEQQIQRYKFFADKHLEIIRRQMESAENIKNIILEREEFPNLVVEAREVQTVTPLVEVEDEQGHLDELVLHAEAEQQRLLEAGVGMRSGSGSGRLAQRTEALYGGVVENGGGEESPPPPQSKKVFPSNIYTPTPLVPLAQQQQLRESHDSFKEEEGATQVPETHRCSITTPLPLSTSHQSMLGEKQRGSLSTGADAGTPPKPAHNTSSSYIVTTTASALSRNGSNATSKHSVGGGSRRSLVGAADEEVVMVERNGHSIHRSRDGSTTRLFGGGGGAVTATVHPHPQQHHQRMSAATPGFSASNYGEMLECTTSYTAQGEE